MTSASCGLMALAALAWGTPAEAPAAAPSCASACAAPCACLSLDGLVRMSREELEALYCQAQPGPIPEGYTCGRSIRHAGTCLAVPSSKMTGKLWHGKLFDGCSGTLTNQWCHGIQAVRAKVCYGESWFDGRPAIVMDYRGVSPIIWHNVRDEIRQVAPNLYLGIMYQEKHCQPKFKMFFALEVPECCGCCP